MAELQTNHLEVARKFREGSFTVQKTEKVFSTIATRHMNRTTPTSKVMAEQLALLATPAPCCVGWLPGLEVAKAIDEFQDGDEHRGRRVDTRHRGRRVDTRHRGRRVDTRHRGRRVDTRHRGRRVDTRHHDTTLSVHTSFAKKMSAPLSA